jgi:hypothetical protein
MATEAATVDAILRSSFYAFVIKAFETVNPGREFLQNWHIELMCWTLSRAHAGELHRLIFSLCPRSLKSFVTSVAFPAWVMGLDPTRRFICISYSEDLAIKHSRDFHMVVRMPWYAETFPAIKFDTKKFTEHEVGTIQNGFRYATSVGGTLTGRGADYVIIDDPIKTDGAMSEAERSRVNEWYSSTVPTRFDNPKKAF